MKISLGFLLVWMLFVSGCIAKQQNVASNNGSVTVPNVTSQHLNDELVGTPGGTLTYRASIYGMDKPPLPPVQQNTTYIPAFSGTMALTYRESIETPAGETRNDIMNLDASAVPELSDPLLVNYRFEGLPEGFTIEQTHAMYGGVGPRYDNRIARVVFAITIDPLQIAAEYRYSIHLEYQGIDFGVIPGVIKVFPAGT